MKDRNKSLFLKTLKAYITLLLISIPFLLITACDTNMFHKSEEPKDIGDVMIKENVHFEGKNVGGMEKTEVLIMIEEHAEEINVPAKDAKIDPSTWEVTKEKSGLKVNIGDTLENILKAEEGQNIKLTVEEVQPDITYKNLNDNLVEIGMYSTPIVDKSLSRTNNIEIAAQKINNKVLLANEEFSFNDVVGERSEDKGYEYAPIIIRTEEGGKKEEGIGGGICQLSTTIFNAIEECGLEITERHTHSSDVTYVSEGEDAAVSYGSIDLKFKNNREYPIMLKIHINDDTLLVKILENRN